LKRDLMTKLTDTQLLILSKAAQREDHAIELPPNLKGGAANKVVTRLINGGLAEEVAAKPEMPVWRRDDDGQSLALIITHAAFEALGIEPDTDAGLSRSPQSAAEDDRKRRGKGARPRVDSNSESTTETSPETHSAPRAGTKQALIITLLEGEQGATLDELVTATGWLPHTTRAALTGLRKKGYTIAKEKGESGKTVYRIEANAEPSKEPAAGETSEAA
jgi:hypothetical protein